MNLEERRDYYKKKRVVEHRVCLLDFEYLGENTYDDVSFFIFDIKLEVINSTSIEDTYISGRCFIPEYHKWILEVEHYYKMKSYDKKTGRIILSGKLD